jgi:SAM-dependent methyltransferase
VWLELIKRWTKSYTSAAAVDALGYTGVRVMRYYETKIRVPMPDWLRGVLRSAKRSVTGTGKILINAWGDRDIEYSYIASRLPQGPGEALDFGSAFANLSLHAIQRGWNVTGVDLLPHPIYWKHPGFRFVQGDFLQLEFPAGSFDLILNCSAVEHVGLPGRYDLKAPETDGDLAAMKKMLQLLKPGGMMLLTIPVGQDAVIAPLHRVYGANRLPKLLEGYDVTEKLFWVKNAENVWLQAEQSAAFAYIPTSDGEDTSRCSYALGCLTLRKTR